MGLVGTNPAVAVQIRPSVDRLMGALATTIERTNSGKADDTIRR